MVAKIVLNEVVSLCLHSEVSLLGDDRVRFDRDYGCPQILVLYHSIDDRIVIGTCSQSDDIEIFL